MTMNQAVTYFKTTAKAIAKLLHPFAEVVIHNLATDKIEAIYNPFSKREVGSESYLERMDFDNTPDNIIGPYEKLNYDGRRLKSITIIIRDEANKPIGLCCINFDVSSFDKINNTLNLFLNTSSTVSSQQEELFKNDLYENINIFVQDYCLENKLNINNLSRDNKKSLILELKNHGALAGKNAAHYIASILDISRASVYNYLKN